MFNWSQPKSQLSEEKRAWFDIKIKWLMDTFGVERLLSPIVLPTTEFFPDRYHPSQRNAEILFNRICELMSIERSRIDLLFYTSKFADDKASAEDPSRNFEYDLGAYENESDRNTIWIEQTHLDEWESLVCTMAQQLANVHLVEGHNISTEIEDYGPLNNLLTVYFGFGIFAANSVVRAVTWRGLGQSGWRIGRAGFLSMQEYAYALAVLADLRDDFTPKWLKLLRPDVRSLFRTEMKLLCHDDKNISGIDRYHDRISKLESTEIRYFIDPPYSSSSLQDQELTPDAETEAESETELSESDQLSVLLLQGVEEMQQGEFESAIEIFSQCLEIEPEDTEVLNERGQAYLKTGKFSNALQDFSHALTVDEKFYEARKGRALSYVWLRKYAEAHEDAKTALKYDREDGMLHLISGLSLKAADDYKKALKSLNLAAHYAPLMAETYMIRSFVQEKLHNYSRAEADKKEAIRRAPDLEDPEYRKNSLASL